MTRPINVYYWPTPKGWKVTILLEELSVPYNRVPVDIGAGEQFAPEFLKISPKVAVPESVAEEVWSIGGALTLDRLPSLPL